ncbi:DUF4861 domain-containing protein [bacterium]|nr:DUF4861 domain-containing protein [bacterium]
MKKFVFRALILAFILAPASICHAQSMSAVLGTAAVTLDSAKVAQVKAGVAGTRFYYDTNSDGKMDECWFIDIDPIHSSTYKPMLVKVIDKSGKLAVGKEPSHADAVWLADYSATGGVADKAIIYEDYDDDGDMDSMLMFFNSYWWWARDDGDDNALWWDRNYSYDQNACQDHCGFGADESFFAVQFFTTTQSFAPRYEAPFLFWDNNHDGRADDVMRIAIAEATQPTSVVSLRWGLNPTGYGTSEDPRHYICSISAHPVSGMTIGSPWLTSQTIYGFPVTPITDRDKARQWAASSTWKDGMFTWVENGNNVGWASGDSYGVKSERWEGVIANGSTTPPFTAIGGPTVGPFNNRYEYLGSPTAPFAFYYNPADHRIHMKKATYTWIETDWDSNATGDMKYTWTDANSDGIVDHINFDIDNNGTTDDQWDIATNQIQNVSFDWQQFHDIYTPLENSFPAQLYDLDRSLAAALETVQAGSSTDAVWTFVENKYSNSSIPEWKRLKFLPQNNTLMYYLELVRDRRIYKLKTLATGSGYTAFWTSFNAARTTGDTSTMASLLRSRFGTTPNWTAFSTWIANIRKPTTKRVDSSTAWGSSSIAWETEKAAWRIMSGRFDFLGKREKRLVLSGLTSSTDLSTDTGGWGMDSFNEGTGPGAGGLTLYINGAAYPLYGSASATYRVVSQTNDAVTVEMLVSNVGPASAKRTVQVRATAQADRPDAQFSAVVTGGPATDKLELGIGLARPAENYFEHRAESGILGLWGFQTPQIDWVGLGMIYPRGVYSRTLQSSGEIDVILNATLGQPVDWTIQNDWRRGHRFSNFPVLANWMNDLTQTAALVGYPSGRNAARDNWTVLR